jgi:hypothetical protein
MRNHTHHTTCTFNPYVSFRCAGYGIIIVTPSPDCRCFEFHHDLIEHLPILHLCPSSELFPIQRFNPLSLCILLIRTHSQQWCVIVAVHRLGKEANKFSLEGIGFQSPLVLRAVGDELTRPLELMLRLQDNGRWSTWAAKLVFPSN